MFYDDRGYFFENYNKKAFEDFGITTDFVQDNISYSKFGSIRGLHFQKNPNAQEKLIRVIRGKIIDVAVDIRKESDSYGTYTALELSSDNNKQLYIPRGFAHGFSVLSEYAIIEYKCDNFYNKDKEMCINPNDMTLGIDWKIPKIDMTLSKKDQSGITFKEYSTNPCF
jgi:dTDP-4-dehydrorhamnose 3,5-epimerase